MIFIYKRIVTLRQWFLNRGTRPSGEHERFPGDREEYQDVVGRRGGRRTCCRLRTTYLRNIRCVCV